MCGSVRLCHTNWSRRIRHCTCAPVSCWPAMAALFHCCCCCLLEHLSFAKYSQSMAMMRLCVLCVCVCACLCHLYSSAEPNERNRRVSLCTLWSNSCDKLVRRANKGAMDKQTKLPSHQTWQVKVSLWSGYDNYLLFILWRQCEQCCRKERDTHSLSTWPRLHSPSWHHFQ